MKMQGEWVKGEIANGKWIYPNGVYFEGEFKNNKPSGHGTWHFANGNTLEGTFSQQAKAADEEEPAEEEEGAKPKLDLVWQANT